MTIHWKVLGKHFLMVPVPLVVRFIQFSGNKCIFCIFLKKPVLKELMGSFNSLMTSEGQETGTIAPAPENAHKNLRGIVEVKKTNM
jgi:hypothetical protein